MHAGVGSFRRPLHDPLVANAQRLGAGDLLAGWPERDHWNRCVSILPNKTVLAEAVGADQQAFIARVDICHLGKGIVAATWAPFLDRHRVGYGSDLVYHDSSKNDMLAICASTLQFGSSRMLNVSRSPSIDAAANTSHGAEPAGAPSTTSV
jgi:hypothetical protein